MSQPGQNQEGQAATISLSGPVEFLNGKFCLRVPLAVGGSRFVGLTKGIGHVEGEILVIEIQEWMARKFNLVAGIVVDIDDRDGKFNLYPYPIFRRNVVRAAGYVPGEQPTDSTTIKLNTNENPYPPSPRVMEAIRAVTVEQLRRYPSPSGQAFRIAAGRVHGVGPEWILPFNGGDELLSVAIRACAGESDAVAFLEPSYSLYPVLTEMNGSRKVVLSYRIEGTRWALPEGIEKTPAKILLIVNPNAPSGHFEPVERLAEIAAAFPGLLLIDEAYVDFAPASALELVKRFGNVVILRTMSKGYSLAGLRFGYCVGRPEVLREIEKVRDSYPVDVVAIAAATASVEDQAYAKGTWEKVIAERGRLSGELRGMGFEMPESASNFLLATVPGGNARAVYEGLKARGILVRWWDLPRIADKVRITVGTPEQNDRLLAEIKAMRSEPRP